MTAWTALRPNPSTFRQWWVLTLRVIAPSLRSGELLILDVREREASDAGHLPGARLLPRGQLELRVNQELPDPMQRILVYCEFGQISTLAAATLRNLGFQRALALDGGMRAWREAGFPVTVGSRTQAEPPKTPRADA